MGPVSKRPKVVVERKPIHLVSQCNGTPCITHIALCVITRKVNPPRAGRKQEFRDLVEGAFDLSDDNLTDIQKQAQADITAGKVSAFIS